MNIIDNGLVKSTGESGGVGPNSSTLHHLKDLLTDSSELLIVSPYFGADLLGAKDLFESFTQFFLRGGKIRILINKEMSANKSPFKHDDAPNEDLSSWVKQLERSRNLIRSWGNPKDQRFFVKIADGFCHAKAYVSKHAASSTSASYKAIIGSSNFTWSGLTREGELCVRIDSSNEAKQVWDWAEYIWNQHATLSPELENQLFHLVGLNHFVSIQDACFRLLIEDRYQKQHIDLNSNRDIQGVPELLRTGLESFQKEGAIRALHILEKHGIVLIADPTGFGKTWEAGAVMFAELAKEYGASAVIVCPASAVNRPWNLHLKKWNCRLNVPIISHERLSRKDGVDALLDPNVKVIVIDEAHRFKNGNVASGTGIVSNRFSVLQNILEERASKGTRPKVILLSATPISNSVWDLANLLSFGTGPQLESSAFEKEYRQPLRSMFNESMRHTTLLENIMEAYSVRRTRTTLLKSGAKSTFPEKHIAFNRPYSSDNILEELLSQIDLLQFSTVIPRAGALVRSTLVKSLESSKPALGIWAARQLCKIEKTTKLPRELGALIPERFLTEILDLPSEVDIENNEELDDESAAVATVDKTSVPSLKKILSLVVESVSNDYLDPKVATLIEILREEAKIQTSRSKKATARAIIFGISRPTVYFLASILPYVLKKHDINANVYPVTGLLNDGEREKLCLQFNPSVLSQDSLDKGSFEILISTDVFAEGQDLHASPCMISYDVPWTPSRIIQRAGRVDRVGAPHNEVRSYILRPPNQINERFYRFLERSTSEENSSAALGLVGGIEKKAEIMQGAGILNIKIFDVEQYENDYFKQPSYDLRKLEEQLVSDPRTEQSEVINSHFSKIIPESNDHSSLSFLGNHELDLMRTNIATPVFAIDNSGILNNECLALFAFFEGKKLPEAGEGKPLRVAILDDKRWSHSATLDGQRITWLRNWWEMAADKKAINLTSQQVAALEDLIGRATTFMLTELNVDSGVNLFTWQAKEKTTLRNSLSFSEDSCFAIIRAYERCIVGKKQDDAIRIRKELSAVAEKTGPEACLEFLKGEGAIISDLETSNTPILGVKDVTLVGAIISLDALS